MEEKRLRVFCFLVWMGGIRRNIMEKNICIVWIYLQGKKSEALNTAYTAYIFLVGRSSPCLDFVLCPNYESEINAGEKTYKRLFLFDFKILSLSIL